MDTDPILDLGEWLDLAPWRTRKVTLIDLATMEQTHNLTGKREMLTQPGGTILAVWTGQWSSSARRIRTADRDAVLARLA